MRCNTTMKQLHTQHSRVHQRNEKLATTITTNSHTRHSQKTQFEARNATVYADSLDSGRTALQ
jgi:hypothetical protein